MNYQCVKVKKLAGFLVVGVFSLCLAISTRAQGKPAGAGPPPNNNPNISDRVRQIDEGKLRGAEANAMTASTLRSHPTEKPSAESRFTTYSDITSSYDILR